LQGRRLALTHDPRLRILPRVSKLRLGIIGVGKHGTRYAKHAAEDLDGVELVAVWRRDAVQGREVARRYGCEYVADAQALIARGDVDAIVFAAVPALLEDLVVAAAKAGKKLLVEKPVAYDLESGLRIESAIAAAGVYCMAGHTLRFNRVVNEIRERLGSLGRIDSLVFSQRFPPQLALEWLDTPELSGGGNVMHTGVHCFDAIRYIAALEPAEVWCTMRSVYTRRTEDSFVACITFRDSNALAMVTCSRTTRGRNGTIEIAGEHGQLVGDHVLNALYRLGPDGREDFDVGPPHHTVLEALRQFVADASSGVAPRASYRDGLTAVAVARACYASAASRRPQAVVLPQVGP
jgi:predicted dehydrogenase